MQLMGGESSSGDEWTPVGDISSSNGEIGPVFLNDVIEKKQELGEPSINTKPTGQLNFEKCDTSTISLNGKSVVVNHATGDVKRADDTLTTSLNETTTDAQVPFDNTYTFPNFGMFECAEIGSLDGVNFYKIGSASW